jgi:general secretion pathway protein K
MRPVNKQSGLVLIAVLWVVVVLIVIAATVGRKSRLDSAVCLAGTEQLRCNWACRAGMETAIAVLNEDDRISDSLTDLWSDNEADFNDIPLERCSFTVKVVDEASKLNINTATKEQLMQLDYMTEEIADAIKDWRDKDDEPTAGGAEEGYYRNLPYGYSIRNGPFKTIRELLLVKDVTEQLLYGEDTNFNDKLDFNENDGDKSPPPDDADGVLDKGWIAYLTCYSYDRNVDAIGNERLNINSADEEKLQQSLDISEGQAKWIVENRKDDGYKSIADLINSDSPKKPSEKSNKSKKSKKDSESAVPLDMQTFSQIADKITTDKQQQVPGKININTASKVVLTALMGEDESAQSVAEAIVAYRESLLFGMESIADVLKAESVGISQFKKIAPYITTRSDVFIIRCLSTADRGPVRGTTLQREVVVDRNSMPPKILYQYQGAPPYLATANRNTNDE